MIWLTGPTVLLWLTLCKSSAQEDKVYLELLYPPATITSTRGSSVKLSCNAIYDFEACGLLQVGWYDLTAELTDPHKYLTTMNETVTEGNIRNRQIVTEILNLTPEDAGQFQCRAKCADGETLIGHYIGLTVKG